MKCNYDEDDSQAANSIVKETPDHTNTCGDEWDTFKEYTSALTRIEDLKMLKLWVEALIF